MSTFHHQFSPMQKLRLHIQLKNAALATKPKFSLVSNQSAVQLALLEKNKQAAKEMLLSIKTLLAQRPR